MKASYPDDMQLSGLEANLGRKSLRDEQLVHAAIFQRDVAYPLVFLQVLPRVGGGFYWGFPHADIVNWGEPEPAALRRAITDNVFPSTFTILPRLSYERTTIEDNGYLIITHRAYAIIAHPGQNIEAGPAIHNRRPHEWVPFHEARGRLINGGQLELFDGIIGRVREKGILPTAKLYDFPRDRVYAPEHEGFCLPGPIIVYSPSSRALAPPPPQNGAGQGR